jgi:hypothetical protein
MHWSRALDLRFLSTGKCCNRCDNIIEPSQIRLPMKASEHGHPYFLVCTLLCIWLLFCITDISTGGRGFFSHPSLEANISLVSVFDELHCLVWKNDHPLTITKYWHSPQYRMEFVSPIIHHQIRHSRQSSITMKKTVGLTRWMHIQTLVMFTTVLTTFVKL